MTIAREMVARQVPVRRIAAQLGEDESTLRYRLAPPVEPPQLPEQRLRT